jgi:hypothetical protein
MDVDDDEYLREMERNLGIKPLMPGEREEKKTASQELRKTVLERARMELGKLKEKIMGKMILRNRVTGEVRVMERDYTGKESQEKEIRCEELVDEEEIAFEVEVVEKEKEACGGSVGSSQNLDKFSYLEDLEEIERENEKGRGEVNRKRKEGEEKVELKLRGLKAMPGWVERSRRASEDIRWQKTVINKVDNGKEGRKEQKIVMKIVEGQDIGLDKRGSVLNSRGSSTDR